MKRRDLLKAAVLSGTAMIPFNAQSEVVVKKSKQFKPNANPLKIGLMSYMVAAKWDIETVIKNLTETGYLSVELRTTHAHGVEVTMSKAQRAEVKKRFQDSALETISLASGFEYHSPDPAILKKNIEGTKEYALLAKDVGATGFRVFPNAMPPEVPEEKTLQQIANSLDDVCEFGYNNGVEVRVCVHGSKTARVVIIKKILDMAKTKHIWVNWNCNATDSEGQGLEYNFNSIKDRLKGVHMHEFYDDYPYRQFLKLLSDINYKGYCNAEIDANDDPIRLLKYYKTCFLALQNVI